MLVGKTPFEGLKENEKWTKLIKVNVYLSKNSPESYIV
jgi:hypothetical protein